MYQLFVGRVNEAEYNVPSTLSIYLSWVVMALLQITSEVYQPSQPEVRNESTHAKESSIQPKNQLALDYGSLRAVCRANSILK